MKIGAIIAEYNPFHKGHEYQLIQTKKEFALDYIVIIMSPNYVQRGEPAVFDKWLRTKMALASGADIVLELPTPFATSSAAYFAEGAIDLLCKTNIIDLLSFGSESGDIKTLSTIATTLADESSDFKSTLKSALKEGHSFAKARSMAIDNPIIKGSNNILGVEYIKAARKLHAPFTLQTIQRVGSSYLDESIHQTLPSATAIRKHMQAKEDFKNKNMLDDYYITLEKSLSKGSYTTLRTFDAKGDFVPKLFLTDLYPYIRYRLLSTSKSELCKVAHVNEDLINRLVHSARLHYDFSSFLEDIQTKRYVTTTLQRALLHIYLDITSYDFTTYKEHGYHQYIRLLGFKKEASIVLRRLKKTTELPIITNIRDHQRLTNTLGNHMLHEEIRYTDLYFHGVYEKYKCISKNEYQHPAVIL